MLLPPVLVCFRALDSRCLEAIQFEIVIVWRSQRVTGKSTLILERIWACRACCSLLALLRRSTSHRAGTESARQAPDCCVETASWSVRGLAH